MNTWVTYYSATGNTRKVAEAIAKAIGGQAQALDAYESGKEPVDVLFLGGAVYANHGHGLHTALKAFIAGLDPKQVRAVALFATGFIQSEAITMMRRSLEARGIKVMPEHFFCLGRFALFNMGHPGAKDLAAAAEFAKKMASS